MTGAGEVTEIQGSRIKLIGLCLVGLLMTATAAALAFGWLPARRAGDNSVAWGWFGLLFFGFCTAVILWRLLTVGRTIITITPQGIKDRRLSADVVPWSGIQHLSTAQVRGQRFIVLAVNPSIEQRFTLAVRLSRVLNRMFGIDGFCISATGLKINHDTLFKECTARWQAAQKPRHFGTSAQ